MHKTPTMFSIMKKALIASSCLMLACSNALANTWLYQAPNAGDKVINMIEADDDGNPIDQPWIFTFDTSSSRYRVHGLVAEGTNTLIDFSLPAAPGSCYSGTVVGFDGGSMLKGNTKIKEVRFPKMDTNKSFYADYIFQNCTGLEKIVFTDVTYLAGRTFNGCTGLKEVIFQGGAHNGGPADSFTLSINEGTFRVFIEQPDLWEEKIAEMLAATTKIKLKYFDSSTQTGNLSLAKYKEKFDDGTTPSYLIRLGSSCNWQWLVFKQVAAVNKKLRIASERVTDGVEVTYGAVDPEYSTTSVDYTDRVPLTCSVTSPFAVDGGVRYEAYAYVLSEQVNSVWDNPVTNLGTVATFDPPAAGTYQIKWLWRPVGYAVDVAYPEELGTVAVTAPAADGLYDAGTTVTLTATATGDAVFEKWAGDIGDADPTAATIQVTADKYRKVVPVFQGKTWWLTSDNKKLTDGYWTNTVTVTDDIISLGSFAGKPSLGGVTVLDFAKNKSLPAGYRIVAIPGAFLSKNETGMPDVTEVYLPSTVTNIGGRAFYNQGLLRVFEPLLPKDLSVVGHQILCGCSALHGTVTLGYTDTPITFVPHGGNFKDATFYSSGIEHYDFGPAVTNLTEQMFYGSSIQSILLPSTLQEVRNYTFGISKSAQVKEIRFKGGVPAFTGNPFYGWTANKTLFLVPYGNASWNAILKDSDKVTPWGELDDEGLKATFKANFPEIRKPYGLLKAGALPSLAKDEWIVEWPLASGTQIILK